MRKALFSFGLLLGLWQLASSLGIINELRFASPLAILRGIIEIEEIGLPPDYYLHTHIYYSMKLVASGFGLALISAIPLGVLIGASSKVRAFLRPVLEFLRPIPPLAWIPIAMLWFGIGFPSACFIIFLGAFFPILLDTAHGVENVPKGLVDSAKILGAKPKELWLKVYLPASLPSIVTGLRLGMGIAWMTLVAAEFTGVQDGYGLGYMIMTARDLQRLDLICAGMAVIGIIGILLERLLQLISHFLLRGQE
ncbi:MAG: ABC transporter permease [Desulfovibrionaceae bacterium]|nr:ABC transporter permease [Desulfovibrionaceae bacterium]